MLILKPFSIERSVAGAYDYGKHFHYAWESTIRMLAHVLDSLVRVSRRVEGKPFVNTCMIHNRLLWRGIQEQNNTAESLPVLPVLLLYDFVLVTLY